MCFNIAEAANRGWIPGVSGSAWYNNGILADMSWLGLKDGATVAVGLPIFQPTNFSNVLGNVTVNVTNFMNQPQIVYAGENAAGLNQILQQKYIAFWQNSSWEAYYNWRRTGVPAFSQGGTGIGTPNLQIPVRWQYPVDEATFNTTNWQAAVSSQFSGNDAVTATMWLTK
jgi:hypothetical protein